MNDNNRWSNRDTGATHDRSLEPQEPRTTTGDTGAMNDRHWRHERPILEPQAIERQQILSPVAFTCGSSICRLWHQYLSFVAPVAVVWPWLQCWCLLSFMAPVSVVRVSGICRLWLQSPVSSVVCCSSQWPRYLLSFMAPPEESVASGSSICHLFLWCLQYLSVTSCVSSICLVHGSCVFAVCGSSGAGCCSCCGSSIISCC